MNDIIPNSDFKLNSFFIYDPTLIPKSKKPSDEEIIEAQIIFYYPVDEPLYQQRSNCGLVNGTFSILEMYDDSNYKENSYGKFVLIELSNSIIIAKECEKNKFLCLIINKNIINNFQKHEEFKKQYYNTLIDHLYKTLIIYHGPINNYDNILEIDDKTNINNSKRSNTLHYLKYENNGERKTTISPNILKKNNSSSNTNLNSDGANSFNHKASNNPRKISQ